MPCTPPHALPEPAERLLRRWVGLHTEGEAPTHHALSAANLREWMSDCSIVEFHEAPQKHCLKMQGFNVARNIGDYHAPGGYLEDMIPADVQTVVLEAYHEARRTRRPVYSVIKSGVLRGTFEQLERLVLPFTNEETGTADRFLVWVGPTHRDRIACETIYAAPLSRPLAPAPVSGDSELTVIP